MNINELFSPEKALSNLKCEHCAEIIATGTYYENYKHKPYHIECLWDKLVNKQKTNSYYEAEKYFNSLENYLGNWPAYGLDIEEDWVSDNELVKHNNRVLHRTSTSSLNKELRKEIED